MRLVAASNAAFARSFISLSFFIFSLIFIFGLVSVKSAFASTTTPYEYSTSVITNISGFWTNITNIIDLPDGATAQLLNSSGLIYLKYENGFPDIPVGSSIVSIDIKATFHGTGQWNVRVRQVEFPQTECFGAGIVPNNNTTLGDYVVNISASSCSILTSDRIRNGLFDLHLVRNTGIQSYTADAVGVRVIYDSPITPTPTPTPTLTPTPTPTPSKTPLILIPGIGGSELKTTEMRIWSEDDGHGGTFTNVYSADEKVWVNNIEAIKPGDDDYFDILRMESDGITSKANLALTGGLFDGYQGSINFFISNGYELNKDFFLFPYDWRKDIALTAPLLDQKINEIKTQTGSSKVDIVAHSMGGLVARNYISDVTKAQSVRKLFTLGTPHLGSVDSLKNVAHGGCLTKLPLLSKLICLGISPSETKDALRNMISVFQLFPSQSYFDFYSNENNQHPYPYRTEDGGLNYNQIKNLLTGFGHNTALFSPSESFHSLDPKLSETNGVDVVVIAGSGKNTLGQIIEEKTKKDIVSINGDGTVPLFSASLVDTDTGKSLLGDAKVFYTNQEHGELVASGSALNLIKNRLESNSGLPDGVSDKPYLLPSFWWLFSKHSPVDMSIYDSENNHTGPTADGFETNIPNSTYDTLDDAAFIFIPDNGTYNVKFEATDNGSFDFRVRKFENENVSQEILYNDVPLTTSTKAELTFNTSSSQNPIMYVDADGNGTTDKEINSYTDSIPTPTPTPTSTPQPTPTSAISSISQKESIISEENNVLGAKTNSQKEQNRNNKISEVTEERKDSPLIVFLIVLVGVIVLIYVKLKR